MGVKRERGILMMVEYSVGLVALAIVTLGVVAVKAMTITSKNSQELHKTLTAVAGKSKEYATIKAVDRIDEVKKVVQTPKPKEAEEKDGKEDMFL